MNPRREPVPGPVDRSRRPVVVAAGVGGFAMSRRRPSPAPHLSGGHRPPSRPEAGPREPRVWAIAIGIDRYQSDAIPPCRGAARDARAVGRWLARTAGWEPQGILTMDDLGRPDHGAPPSRWRICSPPGPTSTGPSASGSRAGRSRTTWSWSTSPARRSGSPPRGRAAGGPPAALPAPDRRPPRRLGQDGLAARRGDRRAGVDGAEPDRPPARHVAPRQGEAGRPVLRNSSRRGPPSSSNWPDGPA